jgi:hypothetical protein
MDMLKQFLIPQTKMTKKDAFTSSKTMHPLITLDKYASTSAPISQVGGLVERRRYMTTSFPGPYNLGFFLIGIR